MIDSKTAEIRRAISKVFGVSTPENTSGGFVYNVKSDGHRHIREDAIRNSLAMVSSLVSQYRRISLISEVDFAIGEIVNQAMVNDGSNHIVVPLVRRDGGIDEEIADKIEHTWEVVVNKFSLDKVLPWWFRQFYVDSRLYLEKVIDDNGNFVDIRYIDPRKITYVTVYEENDNKERTLLESFYYYFENATDDYISNLGDVRYISASSFGSLISSGVGRRIDEDRIIYVHSDIVDTTTGMVYGYLHKAMKPANMLSQMEDFVMVHRLARSPQRMAFYIDTGALPPEAARQHVKNLAAEYKNSVNYDPSTGKVSIQSRNFGVTEDLWFARMRGERGTQVETIGGDSGGGPTIEDLQYYKEKLMMSLNVPLSRFSTDASSIILGTHEEITREEIKFHHYIERLRGIFIGVCAGILKQALISSGTMSEVEYDNEWGRTIKWEWSEDSYYAEVKKINILSKRVEVASQLMSLGVDIPEQWIMDEIVKLDIDPEQYGHDGPVEGMGDMEDVEDMADAGVENTSAVPRKYRLEG